VGVARHRHTSWSEALPLVVGRDEKTLLRRVRAGACVCPKGLVEGAWRGAGAGLAGEGAHVAGARAAQNQRASFPPPRPSTGGSKKHFARGSRRLLTPLPLTTFALPSLPSQLHRRSILTTVPKR